MEELHQSLEPFIQDAGWLAPVLFVLLHLIRPLLFLPVIIVCIAGGVLFGFFEGAILSLIGLSLMSLVSYLLVNKFPKFKHKMSRLKNKVFSNRKVSLSQVMVLRIMPFVHFHLLSLYLIEMTDSFKEYMKFSIIGLILPAVLYTAFGQIITELSWIGTAVLFSILALIFSIIGKLNKAQLEPDYHKS